MKKSIIKNSIIYFAILIIGLLSGRFIFRQNKTTDEIHLHETGEPQHAIWTCSMHPHIRMDQEGKCPLCGMDLIPLSGVSGTGFDPQALVMTEEAIQLANVQTLKASTGKPVKKIGLYGKVEADERENRNLVSHFSGRIEKLLVNFTGEKVTKGQTLAVIYSPDLVSAQQEMIEAARMKETQPGIYEAAKEKLRRWKLDESQISSIEKGGEVQTGFEVRSGINGIVVNKRVNPGDYIDAGSVLFELADLSKVWVLFEAYENDMRFLTKGSKINFGVNAYPGEQFTGTVAFIDPFVDPLTRVARVRVEVGNSAGKLKPGMFVTGIADASLPEYNDHILIPESAVLWTGKRSIVYVKQSVEGASAFLLREIILGPEVDNNYIVLQGLQAGEEYVSRGAFSVDAASQLEGKPSMMNPVVHEENKNATAGHKDMDAHLNSSGKEYPDIKKQVTRIYHIYLDIKNALVESDVQKAKQGALAFVKDLESVRNGAVPAEEKNNLNELNVRLKSAAENLHQTNELLIQRKAFSELTGLMIKTIRRYGLENETVYYQYCPMAFNNQGDYWLSDEERIRNPYFGDQMLTCGSVEEILEFKNQ